MPIEYGIAASMFQHLQSAAGVEGANRLDLATPTASPVPTSTPPPTPTSTLTPAVSPTASPTATSTPVLRVTPVAHRRPVGLLWLGGGALMVAVALGILLLRATRVNRRR